MPYKFELGQQVRIQCSNAAGKVVGRSEFTSGAMQYLLRYQKENAGAVEEWWSEDALIGA